MPFYDEDTVTDQPQRQIAAELIREKVLRSIDEEIPHGVAVAIDSMKWNRNVCHIDATIVCERDSHKGIIIGNVTFSKGVKYFRRAGTEYGKVENFKCFFCCE